MTLTIRYMQIGIRFEILLTENMKKQKSITKKWRN
jgi:hypothetical protein